MKLVSRAAGDAISATAIVSLLAPAASASHGYDKAQLRVCVNGLDYGDEAEVDVKGRYADRDEEFRGCWTFYRIPSGWYKVSVDAPRGYDVEGDDEKWVKVDRGWRKTIRFWLEEEDDDWGGSHWSDRPDRPDYSDRPKFIKRGPGEWCPKGYSPSAVADDICVRNY